MVCNVYIGCTLMLLLITDFKILSLETFPSHSTEKTHFIEYLCISLYIIF